MELRPAMARASEAAVDPVTSLEGFDTLGVGRSFGTFGELLQGALPGQEQHFMVTFPIASWSTAVFRYSEAADDIQVSPPHKHKSRRVARMALEAAGRRGGGELELSADLPEGKGLASSSADLVATVRAVADALGTTVEVSLIESLLRRIEPSDGVMYDEIVAFDHREVRLRERLGTLPSLVVAAHDEGGQVDTIHHNRAMQPVTAGEKREYERLLWEMAEAIRFGDLATVGRVATRSGEMNAAQRPRRYFTELRRTAREVDALGLACAHSGTVLGILLAQDDSELRAKTEYVRAACAPLNGSTSIHRSLGTADVWASGAAPEPVPAGSLPASLHREL